MYCLFTNRRLAALALISMTLCLLVPSPASTVIAHAGADQVSVASVATKTGSGIAPIPEPPTSQSDGADGAPGHPRTARLAQAIEAPPSYGSVPHSATRQIANGVPLIDTYTNAAALGGHLFMVPTLPRTQIGTAFSFNAASPLVAIDSIHVYPTNHNFTSISFTQLEINVFLWTQWHGASSDRVFEAPLIGAPYQVLINGNFTLSGGYFLDISIPFDPPLLLPRDNVGYAVNFRANYGSGLVYDNKLAPLLAAETPFTMGAVMFPAQNYGYYRNTRGQTDGNFTQYESRYISTWTALAVKMTGTPYLLSTASQADAVGVFKGGTWYLRKADGTDEPPIQFGDPTDLPVTGDWDGDKVDTISLYRPALGLFLLNNSYLGPTVYATLTFGNPGDSPLAGRWDASMQTDGVGVYRDSNGILYLRCSLTTGYSDYHMVFGNPGDIGVAGDWDGNGFDSVGVYRPSTGRWYLTNTNGNGITFSDVDFTWSFANAYPVIGDWQARGRSAAGFLTASGQFILSLSDSIGNTPTQNTVAVTFGPPDGRPIMGRWLPARSATDSPIGILIVTPYPAVLPPSTGPIAGATVDAGAEPTGQFD